LQNAIVLRDPRQIDPNPNGDEVRRNVVVKNGAHPSPGLPGADLFYDAAGTATVSLIINFGNSVPLRSEAIFGATDRLQSS
jgi:hypothetical protein